MDVEESLCNNCSTLTWTMREVDGTLKCKGCGAIKELERDVIRAKRRLGLVTDAEKVRLYSSMVGRIELLLDSLWMKNQEIRALNNKVELLERKLDYMMQRHHNPGMKFRIIGWRGHNNKKRYRGNEDEKQEGMSNVSNEQRTKGK